MGRANGSTLRPGLGEERHELLDKRGASAEVPMRSELECGAERDQSLSKTGTPGCCWHLEEAAPGPSSRAAGLRLGQRERGATLQSIVFCMHAAGVPPSRFCEAVSLLDAFLARAPPRVGVGVVPPGVLAVVRILQKSNQASQEGYGPASIELASYPVCLLRELGHHIQDCSEGRARVAEVCVLAALKFEADLLPVPYWLEKFTLRLCASVGCNETKIQRLVWWQNSYNLACKYLWLKEASAPLPPRAVATGALGLSLAHLGLFPTWSLRPKSVAAARWHTAIAALQVHTQVPEEARRRRPHEYAKRACCLDGPPPGLADEILISVVLPVVDSSLEELQDACWQVVSIVAGVDVELGAI